MLLVAWAPVGGWYCILADLDLDLVDIHRRNVHHRPVDSNAVRSAITSLLRTDVESSER